MEDQDEKFMRIALEQAAISKRKGDVPFGAVIVCDGQVIVACANSEQTDQDVTCHAETKAVSQASRSRGSRELIDCTLYSTVELCPMCAGAVFYSGVKRVVYGMSRDDLPHLFKSRNVRVKQLAEDWHYGPELVPGVLREECVKIFLDFKEPFRSEHETKHIPDLVPAPLSLSVG